MYCSKCGKEITPKANFCHSCGFKISEGSNIATGSPSISVNVGNQNTDIRIENNIETKEHPITYNLEKKYDAKIPVKATWITIIGIIGSCASIYGLIPTFYPSFVSNNPITAFINDHGFLIIILSGVFLLSGISILKRRSLWQDSIGVKSDENGFIHFVKLEGQCPLCKGKLKIKNSKNGMFAQCSRNPEQHRFTFDPTWMDDI